MIVNIIFDIIPVALLVIGTLFFNPWLAAATFVVCGSLLWRVYYYEYRSTYTIRIIKDEEDDDELLEEAFRGDSGGE